MSDSLQPHGLYSPWNSPGHNTGVGSLSLLQGIFPTQVSNPGLSHCRRILYQLSHKGSPWGKDYCTNSKHLFQAAQKSLLNFWVRVCLKPHPSFWSVSCSSYMKFFFMLFFFVFRPLDCCLLYDFLSLIMTYYSIILLFVCFANHKWKFLKGKKLWHFFKSLTVPGSMLFKDLSHNLCWWDRVGLDPHTVIQPCPHQSMNVLCSNSLYT